MTLEQQFISLLNLILAAILSFIIGFNRERSEKPAGMRTHMLASVGACLFTMIGLLAFPNGDSTRVASTVVTGIGFLGAGTIWHDKARDKVQSLTTAASIWATAAVGVAVGVGAWFLAIGATIIIWFILAVVFRLEYDGKKDEQSISNQQTS
ncbi:MAG: MgtC/SapB family protein [Anaerolineae bacterium]|nr:MgtC/SapB family protein [Anaerolineae bacterium]